MRKDEVRKALKRMKSGKCLFPKERGTHGDLQERSQVHTDRLYSM